MCTYSTDANAIERPREYPLKQMLLFTKFLHHGPDTYVCIVTHHLMAYSQALPGAASSCQLATPNTSHAPATNLGSNG